jgi:protein O-GlcNAc transferase
MMRLGAGARWPDRWKPKESQTAKLHRAEGLLKASAAARKDGHPDRALSLAQEAAQLYAETAPRSVGMGVAQVCLGAAYFSNGDLGSALQHFEAATDIFRKGAEASGLTGALNVLGVVHRTRGDLDLALGCFEEELGVAESAKLGPQDQAKKRAHALNGVGTVHMARRDLALALSSFRRALESCDETDPAFAAITATTLYHFGLVYLHMDDLDLAQVHFTKSLDRAQTIGRSQTTAAALVGLGTVKKKRGDLDLATADFDKAKAILADVAPRSEAAANAATSIGEVWLERGDLERAQLACQDGLEIAQALAPGSAQTARALIALGRVQQVRGDLAVALSFFERALDIAQAVSPTSAETLKALKSIAAAYEGQGEQLLAETYAKRAAGVEGDQGGATGSAGPGP